MALRESKILEQYFDEIAPNYQFMNGLLSLHLDKYWRLALLKECPCKPNDFLLDIACGTGDILTLLKKSNPQILPFGLDLSHGMLAKAKTIDPDLSLLRGNGIQTPFRDSSFHGITIAFGFRNMPDHDSFLKECFRILKPGGRLLILELTQPENFLLRALNRIYLNTILPLISGMFAKNKEAYQYLAESIESFPPQSEIQEKMGAHGYHEPSYLPLSMGIVTLFSGRKPLSE